LLPLVGNAEAYRDGQVGHPPATRLDQVFRRDEPALLVVGHHLGGPLPHRSPVEEHKRDIALLQFYQVTRILRRSAKRQDHPVHPPALQAGRNGGFLFDILIATRADLIISPVSTNTLN
jgi:hypothetical protein